jgi:hypothetical protein
LDAAAAGRGDSRAPCRRAVPACRVRRHEPPPASRAVVRFYNRRGSAEQWIKEVKQAAYGTRLSCHRFPANEVRLQLSVLAYNFGNLWRRFVLLSASIAGADECAAASRQDRWASGETRALPRVLLAESHLTPTPAWRHRSHRASCAEMGGGGSALRRGDAWPHQRLRSWQDPDHRTPLRLRMECKVGRDLISTVRSAMEQG